jgi:hypothetical protein
MGYFSEMLSTNQEIDKSVRPLLRLGREPDTPLLRPNSGSPIGIASLPSIRNG